MILDEILAHKRQEVASRMEVRPLAALEAALARVPAARGFALSLRQPGVRVIAEIKRKSPSGGELRPGASAAGLAAEYDANGAAALSVLTDGRYFGGSDDDLVSARGACSLPVLRKDFVVDPYQVYEARTLGADAVLLIVRALSDAQLAALLALTHDLGMDALVETHSADEIRRALQAGARIVGVNNRDLDTLVTDPTLALRLRSQVSPDHVYVAESGVSTPEQIAALREANADAVLIGEALIRAPAPGARLRELVAVASSSGVASSPGSSAAAAATLNAAAAPGSGVGSAPVAAAAGSASSAGRAAGSGSAVRPGADPGSDAPARVVA